MRLITLKATINSMLTPEQIAHKEIDCQLKASGWNVQDRKHLNLFVATGVALCETDVDGGFADYMLFVDGKAIGVLEAKSAGTPLVGVSDQSEKYATSNTTDFQRWSNVLPFTYESNGEEFLRLIAEKIGANAALGVSDLDQGTLKSRGCLPRALALFGKDKLPALLEELNSALAS